MDKVDRAVELVGRVAALRAQLLAAEGELRAMLGAAPPPATAPQVVQAPVARRVRDLLHDGRKAMTFGEITQLVGGRDAKLAARAALKKLRAKKEVGFSGGKYRWIAK